MKSIDVIIGGQFGSEGKGKFVAYLALQKHYSFAVRSGGPNAGHTFYKNNQKFVTRHIPCAVVDLNTKLYLAPSALLNPPLLNAELQSLSALQPYERLFIDPNAGVIEKSHIEATNMSRASTVQGVGAAQAEKALRKLGVAKESQQLKHYQKADVVMEVNNAVNRGESGILEGVQGCGLSLNNHWYPFCTSRDVYVTSIVSDCGASPRIIRDIYMVMRTYPIRFGGNSGPLAAPELSWEDITQSSGSPYPLIEHSTVGNITRRISEFSWEEAKRATLINRPTKICLSFVDYINNRDYAVSKFTNLSRKTRDFVDRLENELQVPVCLISTGPLDTHIINRE